ncbi:MAG: hypothetical protein U1F68_03585 [Gammaproteobacteria bacterium]
MRSPVADIAVETIYIDGIRLQACWSSDAVPWASPRGPRQPSAVDLCREPWSPARPRQYQAHCAARAWPPWCCARQDALAQLGSAMAYYRDSLATDAAQADARYNLELAYRLRRQIEQQEAANQQSADQGRNPCRIRTNPHRAANRNRSARNPTPNLPEGNNPARRPRMRARP